MFQAQILDIDTHYARDSDYKYLKVYYLGICRQEAALGEEAASKVALWHLSRENLIVETNIRQKPLAGILSNAQGRISIACPHVGVDERNKYCLSCDLEG